MKIRTLALVIFFSLNSFRHGGDYGRPGELHGLMGAKAVFKRLSPRILTYWSLVLVYGRQYRPWGLLQFDPSLPYEYGKKDTMRSGKRYRTSGACSRADTPFSDAEIMCIAISHLLRGILERCIMVPTVMVNCLLHSVHSYNPAR